MDLRTRKVRNWMTLLALAIWMTSLASGMQPFKIQILDGLLGCLVAFLALLPFYAMRWMGAGDVKFAAVMGLWFGLSPYLLAIWLGGSVLAGVHGIAVLAWRRLQVSGYGAWLQAHLPVAWSTALTPAAPAVHPTTAATGRRVIERSIPYAGYMALIGIWIVLRTGPQWAD